MLEISLFFGIRITINYNDHVPPHFHAEYNVEKALEASCSQAPDKYLGGPKIYKYKRCTK